MDLLKKSIEELAASFTARMDEFQKEVRTSMPAASPSSNINAQFQAFRAFVMTALENLQLQLQLLSRQQDDAEVRTRRKMLLIHGVPESHNENIIQCASKLLCERLSLPNISVGSISRCLRLGRPNSDKPRAVLVKFRDQDMRDKAWFSKTKLKGSGITISEFLTKGRHEAFIVARKRFGVSQCWTRDGCVIVLGPDGTRHRLFSATDVNAIPDQVSVVPSTSAPATVAANPKPNLNVRARKPIRK